MYLEILDQKAEARCKLLWLSRFRVDMLRLAILSDCIVTRMTRRRLASKIVPSVQYGGTLCECLARKAPPAVALDDPAITGRNKGRG